jgi:hypothetical protein
MAGGGGRCSSCWISTSARRAYSTTACRRCTRPRSQDALAKRVAEGDLTQEAVDRYNSTFPLHNRYFDSRGVPSGVGWQNLYGMNKERTTTQSGLPITSRTNAMYFRSKVALKSNAEHAAALSSVLVPPHVPLLTFHPQVHRRRRPRLHAPDPHPALDRGRRTGILPRVRLPRLLGRLGRQRLVLAGAADRSGRRGADVLGRQDLRRGGEAGGGDEPVVHLEAEEVAGSGA